MADKYKKLDQREHILLRPDTYVGDLARRTERAWVVDDGRMVKRDVTVAPALLKIFDEILVNAADSHSRDKSMTALKVTMTDASVTVWNDGATIPIEMHRTEKCHVPELVFGHLLTGENYDDAVERTVGGRNGFGAKLTNVFSVEFEVEVCDGVKKYKQTWTDNMKTCKPPKITSCAKKYVSVTFHPDFARFGMTAFDADARALFERRTYDMAAVLGGVKVSFDGRRLACKSFADYVKLFAPRAVVGDDVAIARADEFDHVSFVNSVWTGRGGTHVASVVDVVSRAVADAAAKKKVVVKPSIVKNHMFVFVNATAVNPTFDTQSKEFLTSKSRIAVSDAFLKKAVGVLLDDVVAEAGVRASLLDERNLKKTDGSKRARVSVAKLTDANWAGTRRSGECTLVLTEGDSAKALAIAGLSVVGRDKYGVFPLRGKLLNCRDAAVAAIANNAEIAALKQILGLQTGRTYTNADGLRYGRVMVMADSDHDGAHIAGLVMNFFHACFPSLMEIRGFFQKFITPIVRAKRGRETLSFYSLPELEEWKRAGNRGWTMKYYKGLGTSTAEEAREYFSDLRKHVKTFEWAGDAGEAIDKAFNKSRAADRREWISAYEPGSHLDNAKPAVPVRDFIDKELILFSRADIARSIPSVVDGLKPSQRKVLFAAFKRNLVADVKVAQFAGYTAEHSAYHHGEASLTATIVNMAQDFVGSNNVNYLMPSGQFGTRASGGKDAASARYIFTRLAPATRRLFHPDDDSLLRYLEDDGDSVEPEWYVPVLPALLINGSEGIGTGWSTSVPSYDPADVAANVRRMIEGTPLVPMAPRYKNFKGTIVESSPGTYTSRGVWTVKGKTATITELPVGRWTQDAKEHYDSLMDKKIIADYRENHTDVDVRFEIDFPAAPPDDIAAVLKLETAIRTSNIHAFDPRGLIKKYDTPEDVLRDWFDVRRKFYVARKKSLLAALEKAASKAENRARFVREIISGAVAVGGKKKADVLADLRAEGYASFDGGYGYLADMPIFDLTSEKVESLVAAADALRSRHADLAAKSVNSIWIDDLDAFT